MNLRAQLYLAVHRPAILAALHQNDAGIYYEQEDPIVLENWQDPQVFGSALRTCFGKFTVRDRNLRDIELTDWSSY